MLMSFFFPPSILYIDTTARNFFGASASRSCHRKLFCAFPSFNVIAGKRKPYRASIDITLERERETGWPRCCCCCMQPALYVTAQPIVCTIVNRCRALLILYTSHSTPNLFDVAAALILSSCSCYHSRGARPFFFLAPFLLRHKLGSLKFWHVHVRNYERLVYSPSNREYTSLRGKRIPLLCVCDTGRRNNVFLL
jgi:hypothetical protein